MSKVVSVESVQLTLLDVPNECPYCFKTIDATLIAGRFAAGPNGRRPAQILFACTSVSCLGTFLAKYHFSNISGHHTVYVFDGLLKPTIKPSRIFPESIVEISPRFIQVYAQAHSAEEHGLDQIAGLGYRKALEFLVKDYLIKLEPAAEEAIKSSMLGSCIAQRIKDPRMKEIAKRATWLGNDEAHYVRKWVDKDVKDMKMIIDMLVNLVEQDRLYQGLLEDMPDTPKT